MVGLDNRTKDTSLVGFALWQDVPVHLYISSLVKRFQTSADL